MKLVHVEEQCGKLKVHNFTAMAPSLLHKEVNPQREVNVVEVELFGIVKHWQKACCDEVPVERESSIFSKEIIIARRRLNANWIPFISTVLTPISIPIHFRDLMTEFLQCKHQCLDNFLMVRLKNEWKVSRTDVGACWVGKEGGKVNHRRWIAQRLEIKHHRLRGCVRRLGNENRYEI